MKNKIVVCCLIVLLLPACSNWKQNTKETVQTMRDWVDPTPDVDATLSKDIEDQSRVAWGRKVASVQKSMDSMIDAVTGQTVPPEADWIVGIQAKFPWVHSALVIDLAGASLFASTEPFPLNAEQIKSLRPDWVDRRPVTVVSDQEPTDIIICQPFFQNNELQGFVAICASVPSLVMSKSPEPSQVAIFLDGQPVYRGSLMQLPAGDILRQDAAENKQGELTLNGKRYLWIARLVGTNWLTYLGAAGE